MFIEVFIKNNIISKIKSNHDSSKIRGDEIIITFYPFAMSKSILVTSLFDEGQRVNGRDDIPYIKFDYLRSSISTYSIFVFD